MFESFNGLPLHPLVVHAAVVFIPLTMIGTILIVIKKSWRRALGWWVVALAFIATGSALVAKESGEALAKVVGEPATHAELGDTLPLIAGVMFLTTTAFVAVDRMQTRSTADGGTAKQSVLVTILAIIAIVVSVGATFQTYRVGDTGAKAVWGDFAAQQAKSSAAPTASPSGATSATQQPGTYTMAQVKAHGSAGSCWTAINNKVYDLTKWEDQHPGGADRIIALCGTDGTAAFEDQHGGENRPAEDLSGFQIGTLV